MEGEIIRSAADTLSLSEMQQKPVYVRRDVKTTNPRRLFRVLRNSVEEMGYIVTYNPISIQKDAVGDTGFIDANITSKKTVTAETKISDMSKDTLLGLVLIGGIILFILFSIVFIAELWLVLTIGLIVLIVGICLFPQKRHDTNQIWIKGEGEIYSGELSETRRERGMQQAQIISELSISIAGESIIALVELRKDIDQLTTKLEALGEWELKSVIWMVSAATRVIGLLAILVGIIACLTGFGVLIGLPLIIIGFIMFVPEIFTIGVILFLLLLLVLFAIFAAFFFGLT